MSRRTALVAAVIVALASLAVWTWRTTATSPPGAPLEAPRSEGPTTHPPLPASAALPDRELSPPGRVALPAIATEPTTTATTATIPAAPVPPPPLPEIVHSTPTVLVRPLSSSGTALSGAAVLVDASLVVSDPRHRRFVIAARTAPGTFRLANLAPGSWTVRVEAPAHETGSYRVLVSEEREKPIELEPILAARRAVRVVLLAPDGTPFTGPSSTLRAIAVAGEPPVHLDPPVHPGQWIAVREPRTAHVRSCGSFHRAEHIGLEPRYFGLIELRCQLPLVACLARGLSVIASAPIASDDSEVVFVLDSDDLAPHAPTVTFRVVDERTGEPIPGARAILRHGEAEIVRAEPSALGEFAIRASSGSAALEVHALGHRIASRHLTLPVASEVDLGTIEMKAAEEREIVVDVERKDEAREVELEVRWAPYAAFGTRVEPAEFSSVAIGLGDVARIGIDNGAWVVWLHGEHEGRRFGSRRSVLYAPEPLSRVLLWPRPYEELSLHAGRPRKVVIYDGNGLRACEPLTCERGTTVVELVSDVHYSISSRDDAGIERWTHAVVNGNEAFLP